MRTFLQASSGLAQALSCMDLIWLIQGCIRPGMAAVVVLLQAQPLSKLCCQECGCVMSRLEWVVPEERLLCLQACSL